MPLELRPGWCLSDEAVDDAISLGDWIVADSGRPALANDGDDWKPGDSITMARSVELKSDPLDARRQLDLTAGQVLGIAARWSCRATSTAGVHLGGPAPIPLADTVSLTLDVPADIAGSIEVETCLVVRWTVDERPTDACPDGALVWSDGWTRPIGERTILLEGAETRIPVRTVSFEQRFDKPSGSLWAIDLDTSIEPDDLLANVVTVLLNRDVMVRDFRDADGEPDPAQLPPSALAGISVDLVRVLTSALAEELEGNEDWTDLAEGTVGRMLVLRLTEAFGSVATALADHERDQPAFARGLWNRFAPDTWRTQP